MVLVSMSLPSKCRGSLSVYPFHSPLHEGAPRIQLETSANAYDERWWRWWDSLLNHHHTMTMGNRSLLLWWIYLNIILFHPITHEWWSIRTVTQISCRLIRRHFSFVVSLSNGLTWVLHKRKTRQPWYSKQHSLDQPTNQPPKEIRHAKRTIF